jgi:putative colanic acid biosynthesis UDP-glucose lipid carrier transferase
MHVSIDEGFQQARREDPRITRVGCFIRKTSLDELPQFFNVLSDSMSLVGPRAHAAMQNEEFRSQVQSYMVRHKVKPGMTELAQVNGYRGETDTLDKMEQRIAYDLRYIQTWSISLDLSILIHTVFAILKDDNTY